MSENPLEIKVEQGAATIKLNLKGVFKVGIDTATKKYGSAAKGVLDVIKFEKTEERKAADLVLNPLIAAMDKLIIGEISHYDSVADRRELIFNIEDKAKELEITIDECFLKNPSKLPFISIAVEIFYENLLNFGLKLSDAKKLAAQLPDQYWIEFIKEWSEKPEEYKFLKERFNAPAYEEWKKRQKVIE